MTVHKWVTDFTHGFESLENGHCSEQSKIATVSEIVEKVHDMFMQGHS